ncbi:transcriptional repressor, partial [bacterium]|nr:transcriptional repressor [bacterium]
MTSFKTLLQEHGLKATLQRLAILEEIHRYGHIDVDALFASLNKRFPTLALGTLYRNLNELSQKNILTEVTLPGQKQKYEIAKAPHVHLICEQCGKIEDKTIDLHAVIAQLEEENHYKINCKAVSFYGLCEACQKDPSAV